MHLFAYFLIHVTWPCSLQQHVSEHGLTDDASLYTIGLQLQYVRKAVKMFNWLYVRTDLS